MEEREREREVRHLIKIGDRRQKERSAKEGDGIHFCTRKNSWLLTPLTSV